MLWYPRSAAPGSGDGWLDRLDTDTGEHAPARLPRWMPEIVAALCWLVIRPGPGLRARTVDFQPVLAAALDSGLVEPTDTTAAYLSSTTRQPITCAQADAQLLEAVAYIDDDLWCARTAARNSTSTSSACTLRPALQPSRCGWMSAASPIH